MQKHLVLDSIRIDSDNFIQNSICNLSIEQRQASLFNIVRVLDNLYVQHINNQATSQVDETQNQVYNALLYGFPYYFNKVYEDFSSLAGVIASPSTLESIFIGNKTIYASWLGGMVDNINDLITLGILRVTKNTKNTLHVKYENQYSWIESFEEEYIGVYSKMIHAWQNKKYETLFEERARIIEQMKPLLYVWNEEFIGYETNPDIDRHFLDAAYLDSKEATEWYAFPKDSIFGGIPYEMYVKTVVYFVSFAIKHVQYCALLMERNPQLIMENLLTTINVETDTVKLIQYINDIPFEQAQQIFNTISLNENNCTSHKYNRSSPPPLIRVSKHQFLKSIFGCLYRPFEFLLDELRRQYPTDWDRNTKDREQVFRKELYELFDEAKNILVHKKMVVSQDGKTITDIDACIIDKTTGEIALFQLKWQDLIYSSNKTLLSKKTNYEKRVSSWIECIKKWIKGSDAKSIADCLGVSPRHVNKDKIKLFVIGRYNANYSGDSIQEDNVVFGQWYQIAVLLSTMDEERWTIDLLHKTLKRTNPYDRLIIGQPVIYNIGGRKIRLDK